MKRCPTCERTFEDTFTFCLIDGSVLSAPSDDQATQALEAPLSVKPAITSPASPVTPTLPQVLPPDYAIKQKTVEEGQPVRDTKRWRWMVGGIGAVLLLSIITASALYYWSSTSTNNNSATTNANTVAPDNSKQENLLPPPTGYANDFANVIDVKSKKQLEKILGDLKRRKDIEFGVATIKTTGGRPIANYTMTVANQWGIKGAWGGILLLVAVDDRQYEFATSRQLEDKLPHDLLAEYGGLMTPSFKQEKYGEGILKGVNAIIAKLDEQDGSK